MFSGDPEIDKAVIEAAGKITTSILERAFGTLGRMKDWAWKRYSTSDPFGDIGRRYAEAMLHRHDRIRVLGMDRPVSIRTLYVRVNILEKLSTNFRTTVDALEEAFNKSRNGFGELIATRDGLDVVNEEKRLIVLGKPGAGKTTFLTWIALSATQGKLAKNRLPILVSLKRWADSGLHLVPYMAKEAFGSIQAEHSDDMLLALLQSGEAIVLLDGLDEIGQATERAAREVSQLADSYPGITIVVSCRLAASNHVFRSFTEVEVADFTQDQVRVFVEHWFAHQPDKAQRCWADLCSSRNVGVLRLCSTPLLLAMMCLAYEGSQTFPRNRAELFGDALRALMQKWDGARGIERPSVYKDLSRLRKERMLARIAFHSFKRNAYFLPQARLEKQISKAMVGLGLISKESADDLDSTMLLQEIEAQHGILVERAHRIYSFSHLTLQEFFAARYITSNTNRTYRLQQVLEDHATDPRWHLVISLSIGLLDEADEIVVALRRRISNLVRTFRLQSFLADMDAHVVSRSPLPSVVGRALCMAYIAQSLAREYVQFQAASEAASLILEDLEKEQDCESRLRERWRELLSIDTTAGARVVDRMINDLVGLPSEDITNLIDYIRLTRILVNALNCDANLSATTREAVIASIFLEPCDLDFVIPDEEDDEE